MPNSEALPLFRLLPEESAAVKRIVAPYYEPEAGLRVDCAAPAEAWLACRAP